VQTPLTFDRNALRTLLQEAQIGMAGPSTAIGDAIGLGVKLMRERPADQRVLILLTDGASNAGEIDPRTAADLAAAHDVRIYTIGVGAESMRLPGLFGALTGMVNPSADMDEDTLNAVAERTGGRYFRAQSTETLTGIYALIDALEPIAQDPETYRPRATLYHWPLALAWVLVIALGFMALRPADRHV
ncbi:MAG: VWA domain-containing protein, partial [Gammaproteobacteria bacterium]